MTHAPISLDALFTTPRGSVRRCPRCGQFELRFRGAALTLSRLELGELHEAVEAARGAPEEGLGWRLRARTARQSVTLTLPDADVAELADLLGGATAMLALDALLVETLGLHLTAA